MRSILLRACIVLCMCCMTIPVIAQFQVGGTAAGLGGGCYRLTQASGNQAGYVYQQAPINLHDSFDFSFQVNLGANDGGADGIVFVLRGDLNGPLIGSPGGTLGYNGAGFQSNSLGIEVDTWDNGSAQGEIAPDHIGIQRNGVTNHNSNDALAGPIQASQVTVNIEDGEDHTFRVWWDATSDTLRVYFDCALRLELGIDLINDVFGGDSLVHWGFLGTTGGASNVQTFCLPTPIDSLTNDLPDISLCEGDSVIMNAGDPRVAFLWTPATGVSDSLGHMPWVGPSTSTTYTIERSFACDTSFDTVAVTIVPFGFALINDTGICEPTFSLQGPSNAVSYQWNTGDTTQQIEVTTSGVYSLIASTGACSDTDSVSIQMSYADFPEQDTALCEGTVTLTIEHDSGNVIWSTGDTLDSLVVDSTGLYWVLLTNEYCTYSDSVEVDYVPVQLNLPGDTTVCTAIPVGGLVMNATSYLWNTGDTTSNLLVDSSGTYTLVAQNSWCADTDSVRVVVEYFSLPDDFLLFCDEVSPSITASAPMDAVFRWSTGDTTERIEVVESGTYTVTVLSDHCLFADQVSVTVSDYPEFDLGETVLLCDGQEWLLTPTPQVSSIRWSTGDTTASLSVSDTGWVWAESSLGGCVYQDSVYVGLRSFDSTAFHTAANTITPNGDGINDVFRLEVDDASLLTSVRYAIYNRWGMLVHDAAFLNDAWDGSIGAGEPAPAGVYFYVITADTRCADIPRIEVRGHITLFR